MIGSRGFHRRVVQGLYSGFFDSNFDTLGALQNSGVTTSEQNVLGSLNFVSQFDVASVDSRVVWMSRGERSTEGQGQGEGQRASYWRELLYSAM